MSTASLNVVRGTNLKPVATDALIDDLLDSDIEGELLVGYPIMASPDGRYAIDALLISRTHGLVSFDLVEGMELGDYEERQDDAFNKLRARLLTHRELVRNRELQPPIKTATYAPALSSSSSRDDYLLLDRSNVTSEIQALVWEGGSQELYERTLSALQSISAIRQTGGSRQGSSPGSRADKLRRVEESISTLDRLQSKAVIETVDGVQRIRGLAGSGKTIILALKAAYLHAQHPEWRMAVTFNTRSLKTHFRRLINNFSIEQTGEEPNWDQLRIINSWGAPGGQDRDGIYHEFCHENDVEYLDFNSAKSQFGFADAFEGAVSTALGEVKDPKRLYDAILVDEAQDFSPAFLRMCYEVLREPRRLVYAYDELQNLNNAGLPSPADIFGTDGKGRPKVTFDSPSSDVILEKCYRNSRPVLVSAHGLGFGIYRESPSTERSGLVQMFGEPSLWEEIGYEVKSGRLELGHHVRLARTPDSSPRFLEDHSPLEDLVQFVSFNSQRTQAEWVAEQVEQDLGSGQLRHSDIVVINTNPLTARTNLGVVRKSLLQRGIQSHIAGVDTNPDVFYRTESITCTGIHRAKGNEAAMVYVINGDECHASAADLARVRNRLFTAITRSKAWVRVTGVGSGMDALIEEYERIKAEAFELDFRYPTNEQLKQLNIVHRDMSDADERAVEARKQNVSELVRDLQEGKLFAEDLKDEDLAALRSLLGSDGS